MSYVGPMSYTRPVAIAGLALMLVLMAEVFVAASWDELPLQKTESHIDEEGCANFTATATVHGRVNDLFEALSHPENVHAGYASVFVEVPPEQRFKESWTVSSPPARKIIVFDPHLGRGEGWRGAGYLTWVQYGSDPKMHIVDEHIIGSTYRYLPAINHARFELSPAERGSATSVSYASSGCWLPDMRTVLPSGIDLKQQWLKDEKRSVSVTLFQAENYAQYIAKERARRGTPTATSTRSPAPSGRAPTPAPMATTPQR